MKIKSESLSGRNKKNVKNSKSQLLITFKSEHAEKMVRRDFYSSENFGISNWYVFKSTIVFYQFARICCIMVLTVNKEIKIGFNKEKRKLLILNLMFCYA